MAVAIVLADSNSLEEQSLFEEMESSQQEDNSINERL
jgi:hypothetical protein